MVSQTAAAKQTAPGTATPTSASVQTATGTRMVTVDGKQYADGSKELKEAQDALAKKQGTKSTTAVAAAGKTQESAESLLERLNMQVGELIAVTKDTRRVNERQLGVMADNSSNLYAA
jgi:hypothetical protein